MIISTFIVSWTNKKFFFRHNQQRWECSTWAWKTFLKGL